MLEFWISNFGFVSDFGFRVSNSWPNSAGSLRDNPRSRYCPARTNDVGCLQSPIEHIERPVFEVPGRGTDRLAGLRKHTLCARRVRGMSPSSAAVRGLGVWVL